MSHVKIGPKHQITIPKDVFDALDLEVGDILEVMAHRDKIVIIPKQIVTKAPAAKLSPEEQKLLKSAKKKIQAIRADVKSARGLTQPEIDVAVKVGLIDSEQQWWWSEEWQRGEREAQKEIETG